jgi:hypothetical protein
MGEHMLEPITAGRLTGWSLDPSTRRPLPVKVYCDGELVAELACDEFRSNLSKTHGAIAGGFDFELPRRLYDGVEHLIRVTGYADIELKGSPRRLTYDEQLLHQVSGALRINKGTAGAREDGFLVRDLKWLIQRTGGADLPEPSRKLAEALTVDMAHQAAFTRPPKEAYALVGSFLEPNALNYDDPAVASAFLSMVRDLSPKSRAALNAIMGRPEHRARPYRAVLVAAIQFASGGSELATSILFNICGRPKVSDAMVRFCAEMLLQQGLSDEARDLAFYSVVAKSAVA